MRRIIIVASAIAFVIACLIAIAISPADIVVKRSDVAVVKVAELNGTSPGYFGIVTAQEDINQDGYPDLLVSAPQKNLSGGTMDNTGQVSIFYGGSQLQSYTASQANVTLNGTSPSWFGIRVSVSDLNSDSYPDVIVGAPYKNLSGGAADNTGQAYIFYGSENGLGSRTAAQANVTFNGTLTDGYFGQAVLVGRCNNDSIDDIVISAYNQSLSYNASNNNGQVYVFYGSSAGFHGLTSNEANVTINGTSPGRLGYTSGGSRIPLACSDFNNDSFPDLAVSAMYKNLSGGEGDWTGKGQLYLFYGGSNGLHSCTTSEANVTINGTSPGQLGFKLIATDVNRDNNIDLVVSALAKNLSGGAYSLEGQIYIFYGSANGLNSMTTDEANITFNGTQQATGMGGQFGYDIMVEDINNDSFKDLIAGANYINISGGVNDYTGQVYIFYGSSDGFHPYFANQSNITINGTLGSRFSTLVSGDFNNDTIKELAVGAYAIDSSTGKVYVYTFNFPPTSSTIPSQSWNEDSSITINLSQYFSDVNRDNLNYTWTGNTNIAVSIDEATNVATVTPNANWYGTEYITFYANDSYNVLVASNNITLTVSNTADCGDNTCDSSESCTSCASDCEACPAVSGSSTAAAEPKAAHTFATVTPEKPATADFKNMAVSSITLTTDETANNVRLEVKEVSKTNVPMPETVVYKLIDIKASNIELKEAKIKFKVKLSWLKENDVEQGEVVLMHHKDSWERLETAYTGKDDENAYYEAKTGSLSMFAISYQKKEEIKEEPIQEEPKQEKTEMPVEPALPVKEKHIFLPIVISAIAALIVIAIIIKKRKKRRN